MDKDSLGERVGDPKRVEAENIPPVNDIAAPEAATDGAADSPRGSEGEAADISAAASSIASDSATAVESVSLDPEPPAEKRVNTAESGRGTRRKLKLPNAGEAPPWWLRHAVLLSIFEWVMALVLIGVASYYLWFLIFPAEPRPAVEGPPPSREEFRERARELPAVSAASAWRVTELSPRWKRIVVHHSATLQGSAESFDRVHREERKWENGLGYHFVIGNGRGMEDGAVTVGNRWTKQLDGAHIKGAKKGDNLNAESIGIALVGNFESTLPTAKQLASLKGLLNYLRRECGISLADIYGHKDISGNTTLCPGTHFYMEELRLALANP